MSEKKASEKTSKSRKGNSIGPMKALQNKSNHEFFNVHTELQSLPLEEVQKLYRDTAHDFSVCCLNLSGDKNIGQIVRSSSLVGAKSVIIFGRLTYDARPAVGSGNYIPIHKVNGINNKFTHDPDKVKFTPDQFWATMAEHSTLPVFIEQGGVMLHEVDWNVFPKNICFVMGPESKGIPEEFLDPTKYRLNTSANPPSFPTIVSIPQGGVLRSHNVACAASMVLWDYYKYILLSTARATARVEPMDNENEK